MPIRRTLAALGAPLFVVAWIIALVGLGLLQSKCNESDVMLTGMDASSFLAPTGGNGCRRAFRCVSSPLRLP